MVSPSKPNHSKVANKSTSYKCKLVKGSKPLINFKFYLDIENINISNKIENKIKELGGSIEFFLAKEVTHFITDKQLKNDSSKNLASVCVSSPKTPATPQTSIIIDFAAISSPTHDSKAQTSKHRSRADAMLQRARLQKQDSLVQFSPNKSQSPVQIAKTFGTPIWTTEYALKFLEKVFKDNNKSHSPQIASTSRSKELNNNQKLEYQYNEHHSPHHHKKSSSNPNHVRILKGNYIKIESLESRNFRPVYRELKHWPKINLNALHSNSLFDSEVQVPGTDQEMTRKNNRTKQQPQAKTKSNQVANQKQNNNSDSKPPQQQQQVNGGYCEICRVEYDSLRQHIKSDVHLSFIKNDTNFIALDHLIKNTSNVDDFLKLRSKVVEQCTKKEEIANDPVNRRASLKRNSCNNPNARDVEIKKEKLHDDRIGLSNGELTLDVNRRSRRESCRKINYAEPREDEENSSDQLIIEPIPTNKATVNLRKSIRWLPPSPDERPPITKPVMYKVDSKLASEKEIKKEPLSEKNKSDSRSGNNTTPTDAKGEKIKMKLTRVRQSELSLLSDEAENFMFPKREVSDSEDTDDDRQSTSEPAEISNEIVSSEPNDPAKTSQLPDHVNNHKLDSNLRPKRRNQLERFIKDNTDYYKFEHLNSRLRFQEAPTQPETMNIETDEGFSEKPDLDDGITVSSPPVDQKTEDRVGEIGPSNNNIIIRQLNAKIDTNFKYSFERIPLNEPWYSAFQRQDEGKEKIFEYYGSTAYRKLPFEMGPLLPLKQNCCLLNRDPTLPPPATLSRASSSIPPSPLTNHTNTNDLLLDIDIDDNSNSNNSNSNKLNNNSINSSSNNKLNQKRLNYLTKRKMMIMESCHPRKSPREHASTLAILSSVLRDEPKSSRRKSSKGNSISSSMDHNNRDDDDDILLNENSMDSIQSEEITVPQQPPQPPSTQAPPNNDRPERSQSPQYFDFEGSTFKSSNRVCYEIDKFLKLSYNDTKVEDIPKLAAKTASNLIIQKLEKDENSFYTILNKLHECEIDSEINVEYIYDETTKINKIHEVLMTKKMSNHKLTISESLHLARIARRRKYNRTGWPRSRHVPRNVNSSSSSARPTRPRKQEVDENGIVIRKRVGRPRLSDEEKKRRLLKRKLNSDMFTISSDSLDSSSQVLLNNKEEEELDSVSTRSMFVSDDESFADAVEDPSTLDDKSFFDAQPKTDDMDDEQKLSDIPEEDNEMEEVKVLDVPKPATPPPRTPTPPPKILTPPTPTPSPPPPTPPPVVVVHEEKKEVNARVNTKNGLLHNVGARNQSKIKTLTCYVKLEDDIAKTYGLRSSLGKGEKVTIDTSIVLPKSPTGNTASSTTSSPNKTSNKNSNSSSNHTKRTGSTPKLNSTHTPQFSPRKLRKPRGRWYRER